MDTFFPALNQSYNGVLRHRLQVRIGGWAAYMKGDVCATHGRWSSIQNPKSKIQNYQCPPNNRLGIKYSR